MVYCLKFLLRSCYDLCQISLFIWITPLLKRCYRSEANLTIDELPDVPFETNNTSRIFQTNYNKYNSRAKAGKRVLIPLLVTTWRPYAATFALELSALVVQFCQPYFLSKLIGFVSTKDQCQWYGMYYAVIYCLLTQLKSLIRCNISHLVLVVEQMTRTSLTTALYKKLLRLSPASRRMYSTGLPSQSYTSSDTLCQSGDISNMISDDVNHIGSMHSQSFNLITIPATLGVGLYILWLELGASSQVMVAVILVVGPVTWHLFSQLSKVEIKHIRLKDKRLEQLCEVVNNIKLVKMLAWELPFFNRIKETRQQELEQQNRNNYYWSMIEMITMTIPMTTASLSFLAFTLTSDEPLTANKAFIVLTIFNLLRMPLASLPRFITLASIAIASYHRLMEFLSAEEPDNDFEENNDIKSIVELTNCSFHYDLNEKAVLKDINLKLKKGLLYVVIGRTGSCKSSLLLALMGNISRSIGSQTRLTARVAYVPQTAWIQNTSLRKNIVFVSKYDKTRFNRVIRCCALEPDLDSLPLSDLTPIGRRGVSISGGQNQRVSLARAVYQNAELYLLDDPLSAVDAHVAQHLFHNVIGPKGLLAKKTRVLVTHNLRFANYADYIITMDRGSLLSCTRPAKIWGNELDSGLIQKEISPKVDFNANSIPSHEYKTNGNVDTNDISGVTINRLNSTEEELSQTGFGFSALNQYLTKCDPLYSFVALLAILAYNGSEVVGNYLLNVFTSLTDVSEDRTKILLLYISSVILNTMFCVLSQIMFRKGAMRGAAQIHDQMLIRVITAPNAFFSRTPLGQIVVRFSRDINNLDDKIPSDLLEAVTNFVWLAFVFLFIVSNHRFFVVLMVIVMSIFSIVYRIYLRTSRHLRRMVAKSRPPIYSHLNETMFGTASVRAYKVEEVFIRKFQRLIRNNIIIQRLMNATTNWTNLWTALVGSAIILSTALVIVVNREQMTPGLAGFMLTYSIEVINSIGMALRMAAQLDGQMMSMERINEYQRLGPEGPLESRADQKPRPMWPSQGSIEFVGFSATYGSGLGLALKNINLRIGSGDKVGVVGRTGAGKSSLTMALMRMIELVSGRIVIDGVDISHIGLHDLRKKISIISQEPNLFVGTLRLNLDPFNEFSDRELWSALESSHIKDFLSASSDGLLYEIDENGTNLSGGQRQLVCLARALLRRSKVVILDEATAACDAITDRLIRSTIREKFTDSTVIAIAHRLDTVLDYDLVVVMSDGYIAECGSPKSLLNNCDSIFHGLAKECAIV